MMEPSGAFDDDDPFRSPFVPAAAPEQSPAEAHPFSSTTDAASPASGGQHVAAAAAAASEVQQYSSPVPDSAIAASLPQQRLDPFVRPMPSYVTESAAVATPSPPTRRRSSEVAAAGASPANNSSRTMPMAPPAARPASTGGSATPQQRLAASTGSWNRPTQLGGDADDPFAGLLQGLTLNSAPVTPAGAYGDSAAPFPAPTGATTAHQRVQQQQGASQSYGSPLTGTKENRLQSRIIDQL
eukprot:TRINITY_DN7218_c0_g2_i1.p1 TRINITY_DN7218_c0_g2~~TRINITY_DN7218_c0_g2_i1.p1  ORF type:complete len:241 (+),score=25.68 TRINITY_DN7218_c0_g2_i1:204-926(+)